MKKFMITSSIVATALFTSNAVAGYIVTDADLTTMEVTPNKQFGFGGWNLENVEVKITQEPFYNHNVGSFDDLEGTYSTMSYGYSFESDIRGEDGSVVGALHGKDWPIGEPSGVKVINADNAVKNGKPENCIMTTSYLSSGFLDSVSPKPNICSGPFQSHKRFKIDIKDTTYLGDDTYGKPIDMVFNLHEGDTSVQRYQVFQKINNYTKKRLNGYKLEVLDANMQPNPVLTLSLGYGEYVGTSDRTDIWDIEDLANLSHGLWGPADDQFPNPGFFDDQRVYYPVSLSRNNTMLSYIGPMQGGNYQSMFGNWLPSKWHPMGIFYDHDNNPSTDPKLLAFWGDPLSTGVNGWHKGIADDWASPSEEELVLWTQAGGQYLIQGIEDTANLGLNYIINIGDNTMIGDTFTIRITPHFAPSSEQGTPSYVLDGPEPNHPGSERGDPTDGKGSVPAHDTMSLLFMMFGFLGIGMLIARKKLA